MKVLISLSVLLLLGTGAYAQRRGGGFGGHSGGRSGGGFTSGRAWSGHSSWGARSSWGVRSSWGIRSGWSYGGYRGYYGTRGWGYPYRTGFGYWPSYGWGAGIGYWPGYYDWGWSYWDYPSYPVYSPPVTVVYSPRPAPAAVTTVYVERGRTSGGGYDEWGQPRTAAAIASASKSLYLIAFRDGVIRAAVSYDVSGDTLRYVTEKNEQQSAPLSSIDREQSERLNRERRVSFRLP